ncbi:hypothetical protein [Mucilaginibacter sp.]|uniref:hypothetical protein n=1 Tax=Mucilaginibacter sp. TaxID=1882438 RepID=UPI003D106245
MVKNSFEDTTITPKFKNQGEQEDYWAKDLFTKDYKVQNYKKYKKRIIKKNEFYMFGTIAIKVIPNNYVTAIIQKGIFYPEILSKAFEYCERCRFKVQSVTNIPVTETDKVVTKPKILSNDSILDTLTISNFEELKYMSTNSKRKRFRFWLFRNRLINPTVCFMELTNNKAIISTSTFNFVNGAKLTFFEEGWIII